MNCCGRERRVGLATVARHVAAIGERKRKPHVPTRNALTLVEVVVGLVLMATVLVGSLLASSAHRRQFRNASNKLVAVGIADDLLHQFDSRREGAPRSAVGAIAGRRDWVWRTSVVGTTAPAGIAMPVIRLEILDERGRLCADVEFVQNPTSEK